MDRVVVAVKLSVVCLLILAGCGLSETVVVTGITATNAKNQVQALDNIKFKPNEQIAKNKVTEAIASYQANTGFLPTSLQALIDEGYLPALPQLPEGLEFHYNHVTGEVSTGPPRQQSEPQVPTGPGVTGYMTRPGPGNYGRNQYGRQRSVAPTAPNYGARPAPRGRRGGGSGMGPMGSAMTGIGIQNQLNSMSNAGSSSAGSYARHGINQRVNNYNDRETRTLNELGF